jgi:predicted acylesterase/phospholipase RssA
VPGLGDTLMRTLMMSSAAASDQARAQASVVISPDAAGVGLLEFHQIDRMREQGRLATRAALPAIEQALARAAVPEALEAAAPR